MRAASLLLSALMLASAAVGATSRAQESPQGMARLRRQLVRRRPSTRRLPTEGPRAAAIVRLSGAVVLSSAAGLSRAFHAEAIGFDDGIRSRPDAPYGPTPAATSCSVR